MPKRLNDERPPSQQQLESVGKSLKPELESLLLDSNLDSRVEYRVDCAPSIELPSLFVSVAVKTECQVEEAVKAVKKILVPNNISRTEGSASEAFTMECPIPPGAWPSDWDKSAFKDATMVVSVFVSSQGTTLRNTLPFPQRTMAPVEMLMESTTLDVPPLPFRTLLLSGGGYRAAAYHIGVLRWLYEHHLPGESASLLEAVSDVVGISGGSITAAHFVQNQSTYRTNFWVQAQRLVEFLTTVNMRECVLQHRISIKDVLHTKSLTDKKPLFSPQGGFEPHDSALSLHILATNLSDGDTVAFTKNGMFRVSTCSSERDQAIQSVPCNVTFAISASAAFPPFIPSVKLCKESLGLQNDASLGDLQGKWIADGGIRDNLGIEYSRKATLRSNDGRVLASDAGATFNSESSHFGPSISQGRDEQGERLKFWMLRFTRAIDIQSQRIRDLDLVGVSAKDRVSLHDADNAELALPPKEMHNTPFHLKQLTQDVAQRVIGTTTDLSPLSQPQVFALARLAYDSCVRGFSSDGFLKYGERPDLQFWEELLGPTPQERPKDSAELLSSIPVPVDFSQMIAANLDLLPKGGPEGRYAKWAIRLWRYRIVVKISILLSLLCVLYTGWSMIKCVTRGTSPLPITANRDEVHRMVSSWGKDRSKWTAEENQRFVKVQPLTLVHEDKAENSKPQGVSDDRLWFFVVYCGPATGEVAVKELLDPDQYDVDTATTVLNEWLGTKGRPIPEGKIWSDNKERLFKARVRLPQDIEEPYLVDVVKDSGWSHENLNHFDFLKQFKRITSDPKKSFSLQDGVIEQSEWPLLGPNGGDVASIPVFESESITGSGEIREITIGIPYQNGNRFGPVVLKPVVYTIRRDQK